MSEYKIWGTSSDGDFHFITLTNDLLEPALDVIRQGFYPHESLSISTDIATDPSSANELDELCRATAEDGVTVIAVEKATGAVAAVAFNKLQWRTKPGELSFFEKFNSKCQYEGSKALIQFMIDVDRDGDLFNRYKVDGILEIMFLAVKPQYRKKNLGQGVCEISLKLASALSTGKWKRTPWTSTSSVNDHRIHLVAAMYTSYISQKIGRNLKFDQVLEVSFEKFVFKGQTFASKVGPLSPVTILVAKRVE